MADNIASGNSTTQGAGESEGAEAERRQQAALAALAAAAATLAA